MGLSYAPFEDFGAPRPPVYDPLRIERLKNITKPEADATECNYLVMFFVIGVFAIALGDAMKSPN
jgi:hypothetical protein